MKFHNFFHDGQARPGTRISVTRVQPLKDIKNALHVLGRNTNAVILHGEAIDTGRLIAAHAHHWRVRCTKFQGIAHQVAEDLGEPSLRVKDRGQFVGHVYRGPGFGDCQP